MKIRLNKTGVALVLVLMIVVISAGLLSAIMYYALSGSEISGLQRKYETSKEASLGAVDIFIKELIPRSLQVGALSVVVGSLTQGTGILNSVTVGSGNACFAQKLTTASASWTACGTIANATDANATVSPDITFQLLSASGANRPFVVQAKIIDTAVGNSNMNGISLEGEGVVESGLGMITARHFPYLYTITTEGKPANSTTERANFEILYAY
jgi:hypothetical protein